jgi:hypothetical protein
MAQDRYQTVRGRVSDRDTRQPLAGVSVVLMAGTVPMGGISDENGYYRISQVPVGTYTLQARYPGYGVFSSENLIVSSAKELVYDIALAEATQEMVAEEVLISAQSHPAHAINELSVVSTRSFSAEETQRYPAGVNDPGRMALTYPGVQKGGDDSENDIIIRGNSSFGMLWRLEGIDIPNPNHFARPGTSGGGITVFSAQLLATSDFCTGGMAAEYGNAISGAFDIHFRKGNMETRENRFRFSLLGIDLNTEGPIQKGRSSYVANIRYSTLGLLNRMGFYLVGERVSNDFQDISFNLAFDGKNGKSFVTVFGMGGLSLERYSPVTDPAAREPGRSNHWEDRIQGSNMAAVGVTWTRLLDENSYLKAVAAVVGNEIFREYDTLDLQDVRYRYNTELYLDQRLTASLTYRRKLGARTRFKTGMFLNQSFFDFYRQSAPRRPGTDITTDPVRTLNVDGQGQTQTFQLYAQVSHQLSDQLTVNAGAHFLTLLLNQTTALDPRISFKYQTSPRQTISLAYGLHSQHIPMNFFFYVEQDTLTDGSVTTTSPNRNLPMIRSHHLVLSYNRVLGAQFRFMAEVYYQSLFRVPVRADDPLWWMLNYQGGVADAPMTADGTGQNYGIDIALEKFFTGRFYFLITASRFKSQFQPLDGNTYNTRFGTEYTTTWTVGKEFTFSKGQILQVGARLLWNGGFRYTPYQPDSSALLGYYVPDQSQLWEAQVSPYIRVDARISYRFNNRRTASLLSLDVQNASNRYNPNGVGYDPVKRELYNTGYPGGLIPVLGYQLDF